MADKVLHLKDCFGICSSSAGDHVVLRATGRADGREVRVELYLTGYDVEAAVHAMRVSVSEHAARWKSVADAVGSP